MNKLLIIMVFTSLLISSCASSYLQNSSNVSSEKKSYDKILVVARTKDKVARFKFENQVVQDLAFQAADQINLKIR